MNILDQLVHTTVRIETRGPDGEGSGTGFFMNFCIKGEVSVPTIVTNKHVVAGADEGKIWITAKRPEANEPDLGKPYCSADRQLRDALGASS
jgi:S1-C subfamily serine protease